MEGYIKTYRKLMDSAVWQDPHYLKLWMYCLMKASHKEREILIGSQIVKLNQGEFVTGRKSLTDDLNKGMKPSLKLSELTWWRYLNNLEKFEMLNIKKTNKYSIISIVNWCLYQETEQQLNNNRTTVEQQLNTNKNVKNDKNEKKKDYVEEIKNFLVRYSNIEGFNELNKRYWNAVRETRKKGQVQNSVIYNNMSLWENYDPIVVQCALTSYLEITPRMNEKYAIGIMRNTSVEKAQSILTRKVVPMKKSKTIDWEEFKVD